MNFLMPYAMFLQPAQIKKWQRNCLATSANEIVLPLVPMKLSCH